ncbi:hypothetical protein C8T65DRAFT_574286, partial [Cerioporus squamosus]
AQARHRAKRKAYLQQLEQSVEDLQSVLGIVPGQEFDIPPLVSKVRLLEHENEVLRRELRYMRHELRTKGAESTSRRDSDNCAFLEDGDRSSQQPSGRGSMQTGGPGVYMVFNHMF